MAGLSGMPEDRVQMPDGHPITLWRPLLKQSRADLEAYAKEHKLKWVEDPSNNNTAYRRNAVRKQIIPRLAKIQPDAIANLARSAELLAQSQKLLDRLALLDGKGILKANNLAVIPLMELQQKDLPAANNLLRYWLKANGLAMPSQERLDSWWRDLLAVRSDAHLEWLHDESSIRLWRGILQVIKERAGQWVWREVPVASKQPGLPAEWVKQASTQGLIEMRPRLGSEKIQIKPNTPRKTLKNLFQEANVPPWQRQAPLLFIADELIAVAGVGLSYPHLKNSGTRVLPEWSENA